nr:dTDP-4-dehydrorhamnose 3,5-epimerase family protein [Shewanella aestuarii]
MSRFKITNTPLEGLKCLQRQRIGDQRGFFSRLFCASELAQCGWHKPIAQINHSQTAKKGTVRGLHYQHQPFSEMKLVSCIQGEIWDIAVDVRSNSPLFYNGTRNIYPQKMARHY